MSSGNPDSPHDPRWLDAIFGESSKGATPEERARTSKTLFVRSQLQLAVDNPIAKGRRLTASQALSAFGYDALVNATFDGQHRIYEGSIQAPARTIQRLRVAKGLSVAAMAAATGLAEQEVLDVETVGVTSSIHVIDRITAVLGVDDHQLLIETRNRPKGEDHAS